MRLTCYVWVNICIIIFKVLNGRCMLCWVIIVGGGIKVVI